MTDLPDFNKCTIEFMKKNVIRETHLTNNFEDAMRTGYNIALQSVIKQIQEADKQITNQRKNNISC